MNCTVTLLDLAGQPVPLPAAVVQIVLTVPPPPPPNPWAWWPLPAEQAVRVLAPDDGSRGG